jgi:membrane protease YdiL (CAAX protease family)
VIPVPDWFRRLVGRSPLCSFFTLAYLGSWAGWTPYILSADGLGVLDFRFPQLFGSPLLLAIIPGGYLGPLLAAFTVTAITEGREGLRRWRRRLLAWRVGWGWYAVVLLGVPGVLLPGMLLLAAVTGGQGGGAGWGVLLLYLPLLGVEVLTTGLAEEPGWRGFALPRLQRRYGPLVATGILALLWAGWHLPLFLTAWDAGRNLAVWALLVLFLNVVITWVYNGAGESVWLVMLLHAHVNKFPDVMFYGFFSDLARSSSELVLSGLLGVGTAAVLVVGLTRGRLGYRGDRESASRSPTPPPPPGPDRTAARTRRGADPAPSGYRQP